MALSQDLAPLEVPQAPAPSAPRQASWLRAALFATTAFVGAGLLFVVQPLIARLILPSYGGSATVWSTSSLFFQVLLLMAYGYAHWSTSRLGARWQPKAHVVVLLLPLVALPLAIPTDATPSPDASPTLWLLRTLVLVIGLPFVVVATTGPLLQRWYSWGEHRRSEDPYFLFAASNLGSFGGLLAYPLLIEPNLTLAAQREWWSGGFVVFLVLTAACALSVRGTSARTPGPLPVAGVPSPRAGRQKVLVWAALAFLPSSLMLGVTSHISTDVAAIPLLWVVPLAIYLATFVVAFARTSRVPPRWATQLAVVVAFVVGVSSVKPAAFGTTMTIGLNLLMLALVAYAAHARLAAERPSTQYLTGYFLVVATGGALGGLLNGMLAPMVFDRVLEYPLALMVVPLLLVGIHRGDSTLGARLAGNKRARSVAVAIGYLLVVVMLGLTLWSDVAWVRTGVLLFLGTAVGWWLSHYPRLMALGLVMFFAVAQLTVGGEVLDRSRTFFGSYHVVEQDGMHRLVHGTTLHGTQFTDGARRDTPTTYYSATGPLGDVFDRAAERVAVVGLGAGTVAAYGREGQSMTFFEIDPEIVRIARDPQLFSYLSDSDAEIETVVADGRLGLEKAPAGSFDLILLDAFSSDSIPVHLLTEEAVRAYVDRLAPGGLLVVHISNRVFGLEPVLAGAAERVGLAALVRDGGGGTDGATSSTWVALGRDSADVAALASRPGWRGLGGDRVHWTDDYSSIISVLR